MRPDYVTEKMCETLAELQALDSRDFARASTYTTGGLSVLRPAANRVHAELVQGRLLALDLFRRNWIATGKLRRS